MSSMHNDVWNSCLQIIKDNLPPEQYKTWFLPIKPLRLKNNVLTLQVPSQYFYEMIEAKFLKLLYMSIKSEIGQDARLEYSIVMESTSDSNPNPYSIKLPATDNNVTPNPSVKMPLFVEGDNTKEIPNPFVIPGLRKIQIHSQLNPAYTFENFIEGDCNRLARAAGYAIACNPGKSGFNPLFIYSQVGLGKTHLAQAIGLQVKKQFADKTVLYVNIEQFCQQFVDSIKSGNTNDFMHFYQMVDVLIVDDIQFIIGKDKTQEIFFHLFNYLHQKGKQLIITSDKAPVDYSSKSIDQRLLSRFKWGLAADLQPPDLETRIAILQNLVYKDGITMPEEVLEYLAYRITSNVRELEGALKSLMAQATLNKKAITLELAKQMIDKFVKSTERVISIDLIQKIVCDYFDIPLDSIMENTRKRPIVQARQIVMYYSKKYTKASLQSIGFQCGNKDHATVLHACKTVKNLIDTDKTFKSYIEDIDKRINY